MDTEHRVITELLALKDAPDDALLDQVRAIGVTTTCHMLFGEAARRRHTEPALGWACHGTVSGGLISVAGDPVEEQTDFAEASPNSFEPYG